MTRTKKILTASGIATVLGAVALVGIADAHDRGGRERGGGHGGHHSKMMGGQMGGMHGGGMRQFFTMADENKDGQVSKEEIEKLRDAKFATYDANKDGKLGLDEFQGLINELARERIVRMFQHLDPDGDAAISKQELDDRVAMMIEFMDRNDDGVITRDDRRGGMRGEHRGRRMGPGQHMQDDDDSDGDSN